jgi:membrane protein YqaA with SNARE-associated domain
MKWISTWIQKLQRFTNRPWYPPAVGALAAVDNLVLVIPTDGILISSSMLTPKRWLFLSFCTALGSTVGALMLSLVVQMYGLDIILKFAPDIQETESWIWTFNFFKIYGLYLVFFVAATPLVQQPAVILATLAGNPLWSLLLVIFIGRGLKFMLMSWVASHAPNLLKKMWGLKSEMKEVGLNIDTK